MWSSREARRAFAPRVRSQVFCYTGVEIRVVALWSFLALLFIFSNPALAYDRFKISGHAELEFESEADFDLSVANLEDSSILEPEIRLQVEYEANRWLSVVTRVRPRKEFEMHEGGEVHGREWILELEKAYLAFQPPGTGLEIWVGRSRFQDEREWLYDANLDGLRMFFTLKDIEFDVSVTRQTLWTADLFSTYKEDAVNNFHIYGKYDLSDDISVAGWWLRQDDVSGAGDQNPEFFGLRSGGNLLDELKYWVELAHVRGNEDGQRIRGYGFESGITYEFAYEARPYIVLSYAMGSGDGNPGDGVDHNFRQTGFQDNNGRSNGANQYKFYGELLEPNLSNMSIVSVGAGMWVEKTHTMEVIYHRYTQQRAANFLHDTNLKMDPLGIDKQLGYGVDFVYGVNEDLPGWRIKVISSLFKPGRAFAPDASMAVFGGVELRWSI